MKIAIWGTGVYGKDLLAYLKDYVLRNADNSSISLELVCFFDNAATNDSCKIDGVPIHKPNVEFINSIDIIVVAVKYNKEIMLQISGMKNPTLCVCTYNPSDRLRFLYDFRNLIQKNESGNCFLEYAEKFDNIDKVMKLRDERSINVWHNLIRDMKKEDFAAAVEEIGDENLSNFLYENVFTHFVASREKKTIGIYYNRFYNGGIERVIAQLMPMFISMGYRVVLITEEINEKQEYACPQDVVRAIIPKSNVDRFERYYAIGKILDRYDIDLVHLHNGYSHIVKSMVIPYLRSRGINTIVHVHNYYEKIDIREKLLPTYKLADRVVVLSREDENYWREQGVRAKYLPNPINIDIPYMYHQKKSPYPIVVWIGRIEVTQKQVYDTVEIMKELVRLVPTARLKLIGKADDTKILTELKKRIREACLEKHIILTGFKEFPWEECADVDALLVTSAYEGFSLVLVESKMAGIPAVIYSMPYLELLKDGKGYIQVKQSEVVGAARE